MGVASEIRSVGEGSESEGKKREVLRFYRVLRSIIFSHYIQTLICLSPFLLIHPLIRIDLILNE